MSGEGNANRSLGRRGALFFALAINFPRPSIRLFRSFRPLMLALDTTPNPFAARWLRGFKHESLLLLVFLRTLIGAGFFAVSCDLAIGVVPNRGPLE